MRHRPGKQRPWSWLPVTVGQPAARRRLAVASACCLLSAVSLAALAVAARSGAKELRNNGKPEAGRSELDDAIVGIPGLGGACA